MKRNITRCKNFRKATFLWVLLPLFAFSGMHKFYVSVTQVNYSEKDHSLQITTRIFIDDLEALMKERYGLQARLATEEESEQADAYLEKYLRAKFLVRVNGEVRSYEFLGKRYDHDIAVCYMEIPEVDGAELTSVEVQNEILTDLFEEQKNVVHITVGDQKESFVLVRDRNKGMLNL